MQQTIPLGTTYLGCSKGPLPNGPWLPVHTKVKEPSECLRYAVNGSLSAALVRNYNPEDQTSECYVRKDPLTSAEYATAVSAEQNGNVVPAGSSLPIGGPTDAYALYNVDASVGPRPSSSSCALKVAARGGGPFKYDTCSVSAVDIRNACFGDADPHDATRPAGWVIRGGGAPTTTTRLESAGVLALAANESISQELPWIPPFGGAYRLEITVQRKVANFAYAQSVRAYITVLGACERIVPLGELVVHSAMPETKEFPLTYTTEVDGTTDDTKPCRNHLTIEHVCSVAAAGAPAAVVYVSGVALKASKRKEYAS